MPDDGDHFYMTCGCVFDACTCTDADRAEARSLRALIRRAAEIALAHAYSCDTADLDLAALQECKLSVEGRARLAQHLGRCERCMQVATAIADGMEAERRGKIIDPRRGPAGGVGGSA